MNKKSVESHIKIIKTAARNRNLAIFVGSGISHCSNPDQYPLWGYICDELKKDLETTESDYLKLAQLYQIEFKPLKAKERIKGFFPEIDIPCELQRKILDIEPHYLITTNWDKLFDNEINNNADIYDVVTNDRELVESVNNCKYIKMHGDFEHNNFVFTEDDYLNYSKNFPLIENYIKSILSTHVVLFLGYSFSDIDLKQIENWIQNNSKVTPPIYLAKFDYDIKDSEVKYLEKFRISILPIETNGNIDDDENKKKSMNDFLDVLLGVKNAEITEDPEEYIYERLKPLESYPVVLRRQIQNHLSNCGFEFDQYSRAILVFYKDILTTDYDESLRKIYAKFVTNLPDENCNISKTLNKIISIFKKADIHGILRNEKDDFDKQYYYSFDSENERYSKCNYLYSSSILDFDFEVKMENNQNPDDFLLNVIKLSALGKYEDAFIKNKSVLQLCKRNKDYKRLFISMFNYKFLLRQLKYGLYSVEEYRNHSNINLETEFDKLPKRIQIEIKDIIDFVNFNYLYREIFNVNESLNKVLEAVNTVKNGGFSFSNDAFKYPANHKNLIDYVINNNILIENYSEYQNVCKKYFEISVNRQCQKKVYTFNKYELYTAIKYFSNKNLQKVFNNLLEDKKWEGICISEDILNWMINTVFVNCIKYYSCNRFLGNSFEAYIENIIFILSMTKMPELELKTLLGYIKEFVEKANNTISTIQSINSFFGVQYNLYNTDIAKDNIYEIINTTLDKFVLGQCNSYEFISLSENRFHNLFGYLRKQGSLYNDAHRVKNTIASIEKLEHKDKIVFCMNLLFQLYQISTDEVKKIISDYVLDEQFEEININKDCLINYFMLNLSIQLLKIRNTSDDFIKNLQEFLRNFPKHTFSSYIYHIKNQVAIIFESDKRYADIKDILDKMIEQKESDFIIPSQL